MVMSSSNSLPKNKVLHTYKPVCIICSQQLPATFKVLVCRPVSFVQKGSIVPHPYLDPFPTKGTTVCTPITFLSWDCLTLWRDRDNVPASLMIHLVRWEVRTSPEPTEKLSGTTNSEILPWIKMFGIRSDLHVNYLCSISCGHTFSQWRAFCF